MFGWLAAQRPAPLGGWMLALSAVLAAAAHGTLRGLVPKCRGSR